MDYPELVTAIAADRRTPTRRFIQIARAHAEGWSMIVDSQVANESAPAANDVAPLDHPQGGEHRDLFDLSGRVVIVTGASAGIGRMLATGLAGQGVHVVLAARREEMLVALEQELPGSLAVRCDVAVDHDRARLVEQALQRFGRIDSLVNNAGILGSGLPATRESTEEFVEVLQVDLVAPFDLAKRCLPAFREQGGGSVVNVTSTAAILSSAYVYPQAAYCAAKGGLAQLTKELAAQWARYDVRVNAFAPGLFATEMTEALTDAASAANQRLMSRVPLGRGADAEDALGVVQFLISDASRYVTGQHIAVDGGYTIF